MGEFHAVGSKGVAEAVPRDARTYVSIDIDVLDLPLIPGCVSAEPNGMSHAELRDALAAIAEHCNVVGLDLVEVNPTLDAGTGISRICVPIVPLRWLRSSPAAGAASPGMATHFGTRANSTKNRTAVPGSTRCRTSGTMTALDAGSTRNDR